MFPKFLTLAIVSTTAMSGVLQPEIPTWAETLMVPSADRAVESAEKHWSFSIKRYRMRHHHGIQTLNIRVDCTSESDADEMIAQLLMLHAEINQFLQHYPNEDDYWEIINRELTKTLLRQHSQLSTVTITLEVLPTARLPYTRASIVSRTQEGYVDEGWRFFTRIPGQEAGYSASYEVEYFYRDGITNEEYPDFVPIHHRITQLLTVATAKGDSWEQTNQAIAQTVLQKYPALDSLTSRVDPPIQKAIESDAITIARSNSAQ
jgi:hypothetical protein